jgi:hypothetical protein
MFNTGDKVKLKFAKCIRKGTVIAVFQDEETGETRVRVTYDVTVPGNKNRQLGKITPDLLLTYCVSPTVENLQSMQ